MVWPGPLGDGERFFGNGRPRMALGLIDVRRFDPNAVVLHYWRDHDE